MVEANETDTGHTKTRGLTPVQGISGTSLGEVTLELSLQGVSIAIKRTEFPGKGTAHVLKRRHILRKSRK